MLTKHAKNNEYKNDFFELERQQLACLCGREERGGLKA